VNSIRSENSEIQILDTNKDIIAQTENVLAVNYTDIDRFDYYALIDYKSLKKSIKEEDYKKITDMLNSTSENDDEEYYLLVCSEFYAKYASTGDLIIPKTLDLVLSKKDNDWVIMDTVVEKFDLDVQEDVTGYKLVKSSEMYRNTIDKDFFEGKYENCNIIDELIDAQGVNYEEYPDTDLFQTDAFTYIYYGCVGLLNHNDSKQNEYVNLKYAEKFNVMDSCIDRIGIMFLYTFILFILTGTIVALISWRTVKKQLLLEKKQRDITNAMAHDMKTPLFVISGNAENLIEHTSDDEEKYYASNIINRVNALNSMVYNMLEFSAVESQNFKPTKESFDLEELLKNIADEYGVEIVSNGSVLINADKNLIEHAFKNLVDNAVKYTDDKSSVKITIQDNKVSIINSISDDCNLNLKNIWEPYSRLDNSTGKDGNGLGLSIVKSIFNLHNIKYKASIKDNTFEIKMTLFK
jgi:nitrogen-specific signal transduction histidine kinase